MELAYHFVSDTLRDGLCQCGCGSNSPLVTRNNKRLGHIKGEALAFISGHNSKQKTVTLPDCMARVSVNSSGCWIWQGSINRKGYGRLHYKRRHHNAHRVVYQLSVGAIPEGMQLDHMCLEKRCVNPAHMEPVTLMENVRRQSAQRERFKNMVDYALNEAP